MAHIGGLVTGVLLARRLPAGQGSDASDDVAARSERSGRRPAASSRARSARSASILVLVLLMAVAAFVGISVWRARG